MMSKHNYSSQLTKNTASKVLSLLEGMSGEQICECANAIREHGKQIIERNKKNNVTFNNHSIWRG